MIRKVSKKALALILCAVIILGTAGGILIHNLIKDNDAPPAEETEPQKVQYINVWHTFTGEAKTALETAVANEFKKENPYIVPSFARVEFDLEQLSEMVAQKKAPDVFILPSENIQTLASSNIAANLSDFSETSSLAKTVESSLMPTNTYKNKIYALPVNLLVNAVYLSNNAIETKGVSAENLSWESIKEKGLKWGMPEAELEYISPLFFGLGGSLTADDLETSSGFADGDASIKAAEMLKSLYDSGLLTVFGMKAAAEDAVQNPEKDFADAAANGEFDILTGSTRLFSRLGIERDKYTAVSLEGTEKNVAGSDSAIIVNSSTKKQAAYTFLKYLVSAKAQELLSGGGDLPSNAKSLESALNKKDSYSSVYGEALKNAVYPQEIMHAAKVYDAFSDIITKLLSGELGANEAMKNLAMQIEAVISGKPVPPSLADLTIEAEDGKLEGQTQVVSHSGASNGKYVSGLNFVDGNTNRLVFENVAVTKPGTYSLVLGYSSGTNGSVGILVNGEEYVLSYPLTDSGWNFVPSTAKIDIYLKGDGTDSIAIYDFTPTGFIWLDYIQLNYVSNKVTSPQSSTVEGRIEAESGYLTGTAQKVKEALASGFYFVNSLNFAKGNPNQVIFKNVNVKQAGTYKITLGYSSGTNGIIAVEANKSVYKVSYDAGKENDWSYIPKTVSSEIYLKGDGTDILAFYDLTGFMWFDYFELRFVSSEYTAPAEKPADDSRIEAESGKLKGKATTELNGAASGGEYVYNLNYEDGGANRIVFDNLRITKAGTYKLRLGYSSGTNGSMSVIVNGERKNIKYNSGEEDSWAWIPMTAEGEIYLTGNGDVLEIYDNPGSYMWLDYIELEFVSDNAPAPEEPETPNSSRLEAESAKKIGGTQEGFNIDASGEKYIYNLNWTEGNTNRILFDNLGITKAGTYELLLAYSSGTNGSVTALINDGDSYIVTYTSSHEDDWKWETQYAAKEIYLKGDGTDSIQIYDNFGSYMWLDYIELKFVSGEVTQPETPDDEPVVSKVKLEAEDAAENTAQTAELPEASGGKYVTGFDSPTAAISFSGDIGVTRAGVYRLEFTYSSGVNASLNINVNGKDYPVNYAGGRGSWEYNPRTFTVEAQLLGDGTDVIKVTGVPDNNAPYIHLDYLTIYYPETSKLEAEDAVKSTSSVINQPASTASGMMTVTGLDAGSLIFEGDLGIEKSGLYKVNVVYYTATDGKLDVKANHENTALDISATPGGWSATSPFTASFTADLLGDGSDRIEFSISQSGTYIWIDYINIEYAGENRKSQIVIDSNNATANGAVTVNTRSTARLGTTWHGFAKTAADDNYITAVVDIAVDGVYSVDAIYSAYADSALVLEIDGSKTGNITLPKTTDPNNFTDSHSKIVVSLTKGQHTIKLYNDAVASDFELDAVVIDMIGSPEKDTVRLEAESASRFGIANDNLYYDELSSGSYWIKGLNYTADHSNRIEFTNLPVYTSGSYDISICYASSVNGSFTVNVNGTEHKLSYTKTNDNWDFSNAALASLDIALKGDGTDVISVYDTADGSYVCVDYIDITVNRVICDIYTDKSSYSPGDTVAVTVELYNPFVNLLDGTLELKLTHLGELVSSVKKTVAINTYEQAKINASFTAPDTDFTGYAIEASFTAGDNTLDMDMTAVDVSSDWSVFPRYGYLADSFGTNSLNKTDELMSYFTKHHINGLFYFDVIDRHDTPLAGTVENPDEIYYNLANKEVSSATLKALLADAQDRNINNFVYNLIFGAYEDYQQRGISPEWGMYINGKQDEHPLPSGWETGSLKLFNPANKGWQDYFLKAHNDFLSVYGFQGIQVDSLGSRAYLGQTTDKAGNSFDLSLSYSGLLNRISDELNTRVIFNAVSGYGIEDVITNCDNLDIIFAELWDDVNGGTYGGIKQGLDMAYDVLGGKIGVVTPAYVNLVETDTVQTSNGKLFHDPSVRYLNAAILASGGSHLEIGDCGMLCTPYYADRYLSMSEALKANIRNTYSYMTAYENVLRGEGLGVLSNDIYVGGEEASSEGKAGKYWAFSKSRTEGGDTGEFINIINLKDTDDTKWTDKDRNQKPAMGRSNVAVKYYTTLDVSSVVAVSPDYREGIAQKLTFEKGSDENGSYISFSLPYLEYLTTVILKDSEPVNQLILEAENADKFGLAATAGCMATDANASGGKYLWGLNKDASISNRIEFNNIAVNRAGKYRLSIRYAGGMNGDFITEVNGTAYSAPYTATDPGWAFVPYTMTFHISLKGDGTDVIKIYDNVGYVRIDYIQLDYIEDALIYQAEDAEINGGVAILPASGLSEGTYINNMAYNAGHTNNVTFKVNVATAGEYRLSITYSTGANGSVGVTINDDYTGIFETAMTNNGWAFTPNTSYITAQLKAGENTICIYDPATNCSYAHIDYLTVE